MPDIKKTETVSITYANEKITVIGKTFNITLDVSSSELFSIYMGNKGKGDATLTVHMPDEQPKPVEMAPVPTPIPVPTTTPVILPSTSAVEVKSESALVAESAPDSKHTSKTKAIDFKNNGGLDPWNQGGG